MPRITENWVRERVLGYGRPERTLSIGEIEKRFIVPFIDPVRKDRGAKLLPAVMPEMEKRSVYAEVIRGLKLDVDESELLEHPSRIVEAVTECREDNRVI